jgi:hypothetical protein
MKSSAKFLFFSFLLLISCGAATANAQFSAPLPTQMDLQLDPEIPGPNQSVTATLSSFDTNLDAASISWRVNGKSAQSGTGDKTLSFITGAANTTTSIEVTIGTKEGETINKTYSIRPTLVDLVWQAFGYVPPFYKGKILFSHQDRIQFVALPHITDGSGKEIPPSELIYKWTRNGTVAGDFSGYGRNTYTVISSVISRPLDVSVEVTSPSSNGFGTAEVVATPAEPSIMFYPKHPLYGIQFEKALSGNFEMNDSKEIQVVAEPYYFGVSRMQNPDLSYTWSINNESLDSNTTLSSRVFRFKEGSSGISQIGLHIESAAKMLQFASGNFNLVFGSVPPASSSF